MKLLIAHCGKLTYSETFVLQHIESLCSETVFAEGFPPRLHRDRGVCPGAPVIYRHKERNCSLCTEILRNEQPSVVLAEYGPSGVLWARGCEYFGIPLVVHFHGFDLTNETVLEKYADGYQRLFRIAHSLVVPSIALGNRLSALGAPESSIVVSPYGVDVERFVPSRVPFTNRKSVVFVGRFVEKKRPLSVLRAFRSLGEEFSDLRLEMYGEGPLLPSCQAFVEEHLLQSRVTLYGRTSQETIRSVLSRAYLLALPSASAQSGDSEGLPLVLLEAGASGIPVLSTYHSGIPELVVSGETGMLFQGDDDSLILQHLADLVGDPELASRMGRAARERVSESFSKDASLQRLRSILSAAEVAGKEIREVG